MLDLAVLAAHACARCSRVQGFKYKMRFVYAHFPINVTCTNKDTRVEIRNFLGEKVCTRLRPAHDTARHPACPVAALVRACRRERRNGGERGWRLPRRSVAVPLLRGTSNAGRGAATSTATICKITKKLLLAALNHHF